MNISHVTAATDPADIVLADPSTYQHDRTHLRFGHRLGVFITDAQAEDLETQLAWQRQAREAREARSAS